MVVALNGQLSLAIPLDTTDLSMGWLWIPRRSAWVVVLIGNFN